MPSLSSIIPRPSSSSSSSSLSKTRNDVLLRCEFQSLGVRRSADLLSTLRPRDNDLGLSSIGASTALKTTDEDRPKQIAGVDSVIMVQRNPDRSEGTTSGSPSKRLSREYEPSSREGCERRLNGHRRCRWRTPPLVWRTFHTLQTFAGPGHFLLSSIVIIRNRLFLVGIAMAW